MPQRAKALLCKGFGKAPVSVCDCAENVIFAADVGTVLQAL